MILLPIMVACSEMRPDDEPLCDTTGVCVPEENLGTQSNCVYCGKEMHLVEGYWKTWDWEFHVHAP